MLLEGGSLLELFFLLGASPSEDHVLSAKYKLWCSASGEPFTRPDHYRAATLNRSPIDGFYAEV